MKRNKLEGDSLICSIGFQVGMIGLESDWHNSASVVRVLSVVRHDDDVR